MGGAPEVSVCDAGVGQLSRKEKQLCQGWYAMGYVLKDMLLTSHSVTPTKRAVR